MKIGSSPVSICPTISQLLQFIILILSSCDSNTLDSKKDRLDILNNSLLDIELERALELLAKPTIRGNTTLKNFGVHPEEKKEITLHDGRYGPYVKCDKINASLLGDQTIETLNLEEAIKLINDRKIKMGQKVKKKKSVKNKEKVKPTKKN